MWQILFTGLSLLCGALVSDCALRTEKWTVRLAMGCTMGLFIQLWLPALFAFVWGFTQGVVIGSALLCAVACSLLYFARRKLPLNREKVQKSSIIGLVVCVSAALVLCAYYLHTHSLLPKPDGLHTGQSTFGDMPMHLSFIKNIAATGKFPPAYPLLAGNIPMGYPFLCESISSLWLLGGFSLRTAYVLPMLEALFCVLTMAYLLFERITNSTKKAVLAYVLFFAGSGFGFVYFMDGLRGDPQNFLRIFDAFYQTPTNLTEQNIKWVNPIVDLLIPQRATLFGWAILFACLYLLYLAAFEGKKTMFIPLGILAGGLPLIQTHAFLALGILSGVYLLKAIVLDRADKKTLLYWGAYAGIVGILSISQLVNFTFSQASADGFLRFGFNWANQSDNYFWFYIKNIGLVYLLLLPAFLHASKERKLLYCGGLAILLLCEFVLFQPNPYDNNKLLYIWHLLSVILVSDLLVDWFDKSKSAMRYVTAAAVLFVCTFGSLLTFGREWVSDYLAFDRSAVQAASYIEQNTRTNSLFLTANNHNNAVASLAGRTILCGSSSYLHFHGIDYTQLETAAKILFEQPSLPLLEEYGIDYVYISDYERNAYAINTLFFEQTLPLWYREGNVTIYQVSSP